MSEALTVVHNHNLSVHRLLTEKWTYEELSKNVQGLQERALMAHEEETGLLTERW